jgi:hypothetical protein
MAEYWAGIGGSVWFGLFEDGDVGEQLEWPTIDWTLTCANRLWEASNSHDGAGAVFRRGMAEYSGTFNLVFDTDQVVESVAVEGDTITLAHDLGLSGLFYSQFAIIESITPKLNVRTGGIELGVTWKGNGFVVLDSLLKNALRRNDKSGFIRRKVKHPPARFRHQCQQ